MATMTQIPIQQALRVAVEHHRAGRLREAEAIYRQILSVQPTQPDALHLLGVLAGQLGRHDLATDLIRQAIAAAPNNPEFHCDLASSLQNQGHLDQAIACCQKALALWPLFAEAHCNLANALCAMRQFDQAIVSYQRAIAIKPELVEARVGLGNALVGSREFDQAITCLERAIELNPGFVEAYCSLGNAWKGKKQFDKAVDAYQRALELKPDYAYAYNNLAVALRDKDEPEKSVAACQRALALNPNFVEARANLGMALNDLDQFDQAIPCFEQALTLNPNFAPAHVGLATAYRGQKHMDKAIASLQQALAVDPNFAQAHRYLGDIWKTTGNLDRALASLRRAIALDPSDVSTHDNLLIVLLFDPTYDSHLLLAENQRWNRQHAQPLAPAIQPHSNNRDPDRRLRIGYVSGDYSEHVCAFFILPLLVHHNRREFDVICYAQVRKPDFITQQMRQHASDWRSIVGGADAHVASLVRDDRIDILIDLNLHTADNRLLVFAHKPAPIQVTWLGYPGTTGMDTIDYRLTDPYLDPPDGDQSCYSERTIRLPDTFWCYHPFTDEPIVGDLPCLQNNFVTFGCLNNPLKINDHVLTLWARVLKAVPNSRLVMLTPEGNSRPPILDRLASEGIDPARIECLGRQLRPQYLQTYHRIDIALDTFPYNGHTTSLDSFWMGVPVITLVGKTIVGRAGLSQLSNLGLTELVAHTPDQFLQIAAHLANDRPRLTELRATLRQRMETSPLMDAGRFARNIEAAYRTMWRTWCQT